MYFRTEKRFAVIEHLISAVNTFVLSIAQNSRAQVCKFGESICINMLYLWENRPSNTLKVWILEVLRFWNVFLWKISFIWFKKNDGFVYHRRRYWCSSGHRWQPTTQVESGGIRSDLSPMIGMIGRSVCYCRSEGHKHVQ